MSRETGKLTEIMEKSWQRLTAALVSLKTLPNCNPMQLADWEVLWSDLGRAQSTLLALLAQLSRCCCWHRLCL